MMGIKLILLCAFIIGAQAIQAPKLTLCKRDDSVCLTKTANVIYKQAIQGVRELNLENLDPMHQDKIQGDLTGIKYELTNTTIKGSKDCDVLNMKLDLQKSKLHFDMSCPYFEMFGFYDISGKILSIPITGNGDFRIQCKEYYIKFNADTKISQRKDGKKYISMKSYQVFSELKGGMVSNLTNLFNGKQKELAEKVLQFVNKNWKPVADELQAPVFSANVKKLLKNFNKYLKSVPLDQILVDF
ncbi:hypothetical protein PYW08_003139 [Mythimna loreyi]|uniref:Uncharacterized protein n=1 Tax=Mythimna loreyi TaxID=667449 RepID=A0ACC2QSX4_9NEOP|nr:hypothetical protein PYW08_003139 [Mythimna loreyi]